MNDLVIKGRTVEHLVTLLVIIAIVTIVNLFIFKSTGWLCETPQQEQQTSVVQQVKADYKEETEEEEVPILFEPEIEETIVIEEEPIQSTLVLPQEPKQQEEIQEITQEEEPEEEQTGSTLPDGSFTVTMDDIDYERKNPDLPESDFVMMTKVTLTFDNNNLEFVPFVTFYLYDEQHQENKNQYGESVYLSLIKKGEKRTEEVVLKSLSLENLNVEKTLVVRISNAADDNLIKREEQSFTP